MIPHKIAVLEGDGIGPEVMQEALKLFVNLKVLSPQKIDDKKNAMGCNDL